MPDITLPDMPEWMQWLMKYVEVWGPIIAGIAIGIIALRNHRQSEWEKEQWARRERGADEAASSSPPQP